MARLRHGERVAIGGGWARGLTRRRRVQCDRCERLIPAQANGDPEYHHRAADGAVTVCKRDNRVLAGV